MPLPKPNKNEEKKKFIEKCMGNPVMNREFPDSAQRYAVCNTQFTKRKKKAKASEVIWPEDGEDTVILH